MLLQVSEEAEDAALDLCAAEGTVKLLTEVRCLPLPAYGSADQILLR